MDLPKFAHIPDIVVPSKKQTRPSGAPLVQDRGRLGGTGAIDIFSYSIVCGALVLGGGLIIGACHNFLKGPPSALKNTARTQSGDVLDSEGNKTDRTVAARLGFGGGSGRMGVIAKAGTAKSAPKSLGVTEMRPTLGLRVISLLLTPVVAYVLYFHPTGQDLASAPYLRELFLAGLIYGVLYIQTYSVRYDNERITTRTGLFSSKEYLWADLIAVKDAGGYEQILRFETGKVKMQKYLVGMAEFLTLAREHRARNMSSSHA